LFTTGIKPTKGGLAMKKIFGLSALLVMALVSGCSESMTTAPELPSGVTQSEGMTTLYVLVHKDVPTDAISAVEAHLGATKEETVINLRKAYGENVFFTEADSTVTWEVVQASWGDVKVIRTTWGRLKKLFSAENPDWSRKK
jgi:hypothetical protein